MRTILLLACLVTPGQAMEVKVGDYAVTIADGYGWKESTYPRATGNADAGAFIQKDGGLKNILIAISKNTYKDLEQADRDFRAGLAKKESHFGAKAEAAAWCGRKAIIGDFSRKNGDGDTILGVYRIFFDSGKVVMITCLSGVVNPAEDEETDTIITTLRSGTISVP